MGAWLALWGMMAGAAEPADAPGRRVALVVGNVAYEQLRPLRNAVRDAQDISDVLIANGFDVVPCGRGPGCFDQTQAQFGKALKRFAKRARRADLAFVFFSGHGFETGPDGNVLLPVDAGLDGETCRPERTWPLQDVLEATYRAKAAVVVIDACRNDPFRQCTSRARGGERRSTFEAFDLAKENLLVVSSTRVGQIASDGGFEAHSPFAAVLLAELEARPTLYFEPLFERVAVALIEATQGGLVQIPERRVQGLAPAHCLAGVGCQGEADETLQARLAALEAQRIEDQALYRMGLKRLGKSPDDVLSEQDQRQLEAWIDAGQALQAKGEKGREALAELERGNNVQAEQLFLEDLAAMEAEQAELNTRKATVYRRLATVKWNTNVAQSAAFLRKAAELDPAPFWDWVRLVKRYRQLGELDEAHQAAQRATATATSEQQRVWASVVTGEVAGARSEYRKAQAAFDQGLTLSRKLAEQRGTPEALRDLSISLDRVGDVALARLQFDAAQAAYDERLTIDRRLAEQLGTPQALRDLSASLGRVGDVAHARSQLDAAQAAYDERLTIDRRLAEQLGTPQALRDLSASLGRAGDVARARSQLDVAQAAYAECLTIDRLRAEQLGTPEGLRDLSLSLERVGDVARARSQLDAAQAVYVESLTIRRQLAEQLGTPQALRDLYVSLTKVGDVARARSQLDAAQAAHAEGLTINRQRAEQLGTPQALRDLSVSLEKVGDVARARSQYDAAQTAYDESLLVRRQLAQQLGTSEALSGLALSCHRVGLVLGRSGTEAGVARQRALYTEMVELFQQVADATGTHQAQRFVWWARRQLEALD